MRKPLALSLLAVLVVACRGTLELTPDDSDRVLSRHVIEASDPGAAGAFAVKTLFYGSGTDKNRAEYRDSVTLVTEPVDASKLVSLGSQADERNEYWGFSPDSFPINARVWYPDGEGPFPLVLVVHGNHNPQDFSDPGYDYLGELLASRGFILASVDMNFINGGIRGENDGRGWLLLKHLQAWQDFDTEADSPLAGKVDMDQIAVMGHSRGGEAVGHAAAFNKLSYYPDDASLEFDFGFNIRSVVAIAPVDGQYLPTNRGAPVEDVNYLVFHGSHDGDVTSFHGLRQYKRVTYSGDVDAFKAAVYVYRANHGQWNSVWNSFDNGPRSPRILDLRALLDPADQRRFAEVYVSAFLEATLKGDESYLPLFRDHRVAGDWLPNTMYITNFEHSSHTAVADFEEDIDLTTGARPGVSLEGDSLQTWKEATLELRSRNRANTSASQENQAVWLGWNRNVSGTDELGRPSAYRVVLDRNPIDGRLTERSTLDFRLAPVEDRPRPRSGPEENSEDEAPSEGRDAEGPDNEDEGDADEASIDFTIEVIDAAGVRATVLASDYAPLRFPLKTRVLRRRDIEDSRFQELWELVLQSFSIPLGDFAASAPRLEVSRIRAVNFVFDQTEVGTVVLDDLGFSNLPPAFLDARLPRVATRGS